MSLMLDKPKRNLEFRNAKLQHSTSLDYRVLYLPKNLAGTTRLFLLHATQICLILMATSNQLDPRMRVERMATFYLSIRIGNSRVLAVCHPRNSASGSATGSEWHAAARYAVRRLWRRYSVLRRILPSHSQWDAFSDSSVTIQWPCLRLSELLQINVLQPLPVWRGINHYGCFLVRFCLL